MLAYFNGKIVPLADVKIPVWDYGFTMGVTVSERLRTFNGQLFRLESHLDRLDAGLRLIGIDTGLTRDELRDEIENITAQNFELSSQHDLSVGVFVTPGPQQGRVPDSVSFSDTPTLMIDASPLNSNNWQNLYTEGISLSTVATQEIPAASIPKNLKCRSRMHYYLAEREAELKRAGSKALLLDAFGNVAESTIATIVMVNDGMVVAPPCDSVLASISLQFLKDVLLPEQEIPFDRRPLTIEQLKTADEVLWLSTTTCLLPVTSLDGATIGTPPNRPIFSQLIEAWSQHVGVTIGDE